MATTLTALDARLCSRLGIASTDSKFTSAVRTQLINDALQQICLDHDWPWLLTSETISTVAATATYNLPTRHLRTASIVDATIGRALNKMSLIEMDQVITTYTARPTIYHIGAVITLRSVPDAVYALTHRYYIAEAALASGSDTPLIPEVFSRGVIEQAAVLAFSEAKDIERSLAADAAYTRWLKRAQDNAMRSREPGRIRVRPGGWF